MEEVKDKRFQKTKQVFRWFGFLFAALFFFLLIYFQFPWKLILFFVFLSCFEYLFPKRHRKRVNVFYGVVLLGAIIWIFMPDQEEGWRPYICYDEIAALDKKCAIPDNENAALVYNQLFDSIDTDKFRESMYDVNEVLFDTFWNSSDYPKEAQLLKDHAAIIGQVFDAIKLEKCYFPLLKKDFDQPNNYNELSNFWLGKIRELFLKPVGEFVILSANNDISKKDFSLSLTKYFAVLKLARHLRQQPEIYDVFIGMSLERKTFECFRRLLITCDLPSEFYAEIERELNSISHNWREEMSKVFDREKIKNKSFVCAIFYQINSTGEIRYNRDPNSTLPSLIHCCMTNGKPDPIQIWLNKHPQVKSYLSKKGTKASLLLTTFFIPSDVHKAEKIFDENLTFYEEMLNFNYERPLFTWQTIKANLSFFSKMMFEGLLAGYYEKVPNILLGNQAAKQATQIVIILKQYKDREGHWPESLDVISGQVPEEDLIDPTNGGAFVYRVEGENFVFYSKGKNGIDEYEELLWRETADPNEIDRSKPWPDDIVIWPPVPKVAKKPAGPMISC